MRDFGYSTPVHHISQPSLLYHLHQSVSPLSRFITVGQTHSRNLSVCVSPLQCYSSATLLAWCPIHPRPTTFSSLFVSPSNDLLLKSEPLFVHRYCYSFLSNSGWPRLFIACSTFVQFSHSMRNAVQTRTDQKMKRALDLWTVERSIRSWTFAFSVHWSNSSWKASYQDSFLLPLFESTLDEFHVPRLVSLPFTTHALSLSSFYQSFLSPLSLSSKNNWTPAMTFSTSETRTTKVSSEVSITVLLSCFRRQRHLHNP